VTYILNFGALVVVGEVRHIKFRVMIDAEEYYRMHDS